MEIAFKKKKTIDGRTGTLALQAAAESERTGYMSVRALGRRAFPFP